MYIKSYCMALQYHSFAANYYIKYQYPKFMSALENRLGFRGRNISFGWTTWKSRV